MKRAIIIVLLVVLVFSLCSCGESLKLGEEVFVLSNSPFLYSSYKPEDITQDCGSFLLRNMTEKEFVCQISNYHLEMNDSKEKWRVVEPITEKSDYEVLMLKPFSKESFSVNWGEKYGSLPVGDYRFVFSFLVKQDNLPAITDKNVTIPVRYEQTETIEFSIPAKESEVMGYKYTSAWGFTPCPYDVTVELEERAIENYGCSFYVKNNTDVWFRLPDEEVLLQAYVDGEWFNVSRAKEEHYDIAGEEVRISASSEYLEVFMWDKEFGELPAGKYRIIYRIECPKGEGEHVGTFGIPAEFEIK